MGRASESSVLQDWYHDPRWAASSGYGAPPVPPPNALEDSGQDEYDWNQGEDDNARAKIPYPVHHLSILPVGLEVEEYTQALVQSRLDYGRADQDAIDPAMMLRATRQHGNVSTSVHSSSSARRLQC